jgi:hypothetical protein
VDKWQILEGGDNESKVQNTCSHITHLELINKILLKNTHYKEFANKQFD